MGQKLKCSPLTVLVVLHSSKGMPMDTSVVELPYSKLHGTPEEDAMVKCFRSR